MRRPGAVDAEDDLEDRGRLPTHDVGPIMQMLVAASRCVLKLHQMRAGRRATQRAQRQRRVLLKMLLAHTTSYDMVTMAPVVFDQPPMKMPWVELTEAEFKCKTNF